GLFAATLLVMVALSALSLKLFAPEPTIAPEVLRQAAASTLDIAIPIYVDGTVQAMVPGIISGTLTASVPTQTPTPTLPPVPCDLAGFVSDVTIPDGTRSSASAAFTKVWLVRNLGTCTWGADYALVYQAGELMAGQSPLTIGKILAPGETVELSVNLVAPATGGVYTSTWMLQNSAGEKFGLTPDDQPLSLRIVVGSHETTALDFTEKACFASWSSIVGTIKCPNPDEYISGSVNPVETTTVEYGYEIDMPSLEVIPSEGNGGTITGTYGLLQIQEKDTFNAIIGCGNEQPECDLVFELKYDAGDHHPISLGSWIEKTDGSLQKVTVDLSSLEGKTIALILSVSSTNATARDNKGVWISPVVFRTVK
ncbi:MAG: NBR1-Ig-like domain-containing protein, partial [Anaerolineaceae bacterium]